MKYTMPTEDEELLQPADDNATVVRGREHNMSPVGSRLTAVLNVYHTVDSQQPRQYSATLSVQLLDKEEEAYSRRTKVGDSWAPLDLAWLSDNAGTVVIHNVAGPTGPTLPTKAELAAVADQVLLVRFGDGDADAVLLPGQFMMWPVANGRLPSVRAQSATCPFVVWATPK